MGENWQSLPVVCAGGLVESEDTLTQGTSLTGTAKVLQNMEPSLEGGYQRVLGYTEFDSTALPGTGAVLGVIPALEGVFGTRRVGTDNQIFYSTGSGWSAALNGTARTGTVDKARFISYSITEPVIVQTDGQNPAWKYNGTTETLINGTGAPTAPKFAVEFNNRLLLAPASNASSIAISAPNADTDFTGASGAIEINVGEAVTAISIFRGTVYVFGLNSTHRLEGSTSADFRLVEVSKTIGCIENDTIQEVGGDLIFLANDGLRSIAGTDKIGDVDLALYSKAIQPSIRAAIDGIAADTCSSVYLRKKNQYRLMCYDSNKEAESQGGFLGTYQSAGYEWATIKGFPAYCSGSTYQGTSEVAVFGHYSDGKVYSLESGNSLGGSAIQFEYQSPHLTLGDAEIRKVFHEINIYTQVQGNATFEMSLLLDRGEPLVLQPAPQTLSTSGNVATYGTAVYGTAVYSAFASPKFRKLLVGSGFTGQFRFSGATTTDAPFRIDNFQIEFAAKGRR